MPSRLYQTAQQFLPAGVNSPVRAFRAVGGDPVFVKRGKGPFIWDEDGKKVLDFCGSWGALLFGHAPSGLISRLKSNIGNGLSYGAATANEVRLAQKICALYPSIEKLRLVSSGTEAVMSAIRLARGFTGRKKILKIDGGYHGHVDSLLVKAGSGGATFGVPDSAGIPEELAKLTINIPFNDVDALEKVFKKEGEQIAAFILEPVPANMGVVLPEAGYLEMARLLTQKAGTLLIFDEVITGFRLAPGGAQAQFDIKPDLTTMGKILGGGLPLAAFGGRAEIMEKLSPLGPVYQAGTLSGNPAAVCAALWTLDEINRLSSPNAFVGDPISKKPDSRLRHSGMTKKGEGELEALWQRSEEFLLKLEREAAFRGLQFNAIGTMFTLFFTEDPVTDYASAKKSDTKRFAKFFHKCLNQGLYLAPSQFEANFISTAHNSAHLDRALSMIKKALR